jgi:hypothetical protein
MDNEKNVVRFPAEPPVTLTIPFDSIEALSAARDKIEAAFEFMWRVISAASAKGEAVALASARPVMVETAQRLLDPEEIDPELAAAVIARLTERARERYGEEAARTVAGRLQAMLEQAEAAD